MSFLTGLIDKAVSTVKSILGKAPVEVVATEAIGLIGEGLHTWKEYKGADAETRIDAAWDEFDFRTGLEGPDIIRGLPAEAEEELFDGVAKIGRVLSKWSAGVYGAAPTDAELQAAAQALRSPLAAIAKSKSGSSGEIGAGGSSAPGSGNGADESVTVDAVQKYDLGAALASVRTWLENPQAVAVNSKVMSLGIIALHLDSQLRRHRQDLDHLAKQLNA